MFRQDRGRTGRGRFGCSSMGNSDMVHQASSDVERLSQTLGVVINHGPLDTSIRQGPQYERQAEVDGVSFIRRHFEERVLPKQITSVLLDS